MVQLLEGASLRRVRFDSLRVRSIFVFFSRFFIVACVLARVADVFVECGVARREYPGRN